MESESEPLLPSSSSSGSSDRQRPGYGGVGVGDDSRGGHGYVAAAAVAVDGGGEGRKGSSSSTSSSASSSSSQRSRFWLETAVFIGSTFLGGVAVSILSPFYTKEATEKGLTVWQSGVVYASIYITQIVCMPLFSKSISRIGANRMFTGGISLSGVANLAFGYLQYADGPALFFALSLIVLVVSAVGASALFAAVYPLATKTVSKRYRATILSVVETAFGVGMMTGPSFGGFLFDLGGFDLPFTVCGGTLIAFSFVSCLVLRKEKAAEDVIDDSVAGSDDSEDDEGDEDGTGNATSTSGNAKFTALLRDPTIGTCVAIIVLSEMSVAWFLPSFEPFLNQNFALNSSMTGLIFSLEGITYALFSPIFGMLLDKGMPKHFGLVIGTAAAILGLCLVGPIPLVSSFIPKTPYTSAVGLSVVGTGISATFITTLTCMLSASAKVASDNEQTRSMVTTLWMISENIGTALGTFFGGLAYDGLGFEDGLMVIAGLQLLSLALIPITCLRSGSKTTDVAAEPSESQSSRNLDVTPPENDRANQPLITQDLQQRSWA